MAVRLIKNCRLALKNILGCNDSKYLIDLLTSNFYPYTSFNTNKSLYALEYSDLFYLSNMNNSSSNSINVLLETLYKYTNDINLIKLIKVSNIFTVIQIALDVYNNILMQISYILSKKIYVTSAYQNPINLFKCLNLYYNYVKN